MERTYFEIEYPNGSCSCGGPFNTLEQAKEYEENYIKRIMGRTNLSESERQYHLKNHKEAKFYKVIEQRTEQV